MSLLRVTKTLVKSRYELLTMLKPDVTGWTRPAIKLIRHPIHQDITQYTKYNIVCERANYHQRMFKRGPLLVRNFSNTSVFCKTDENMIKEDNSKLFEDEKSIKQSNNLKAVSKKLSKDLKTDRDNCKLSEDDQVVSLNRKLCKHLKSVSNKLVEEDHAKSDKMSKDDKTENNSNKVKLKGVVQKFKDAYKEYGPSLLVVHIITSAVLLVNFYYIAHLGVDMVPILKYFGASEKVILKFSSMGDAAVAYLLFKACSPLRYPLTLVGTKILVNLLRRWGISKPPDKPE